MPMKQQDVTKAISRKFHILDSTKAAGIFLEVATTSKLLADLRRLQLRTDPRIRLLLAAH
jgi:hypothetical protein